MKRKALVMTFPPAFFTLVAANVVLWLAAVYYPAVGMSKSFNGVETASLALLSEKNGYLQNAREVFSASGINATLEGHDSEASFSLSTDFTAGLFGKLGGNWRNFEKFAGNSTISHPVCNGMKNDLSNNMLSLREEKTNSTLNVSTASLGKLAFNSTRTASVAVVLNESGHINWNGPTPGQTPAAGDVMVNITTANETYLGWVNPDQARAATIYSEIGDSEVSFAGTNLSLEAAMPQNAKIFFQVGEGEELFWYPVSGYSTVALDSPGQGLVFPDTSELSGPATNGSFAQGRFAYNFMALNFSAENTPEYDAVIADSDGDKRFDSDAETRFIRRKQFFPLAGSLERIHSLSADGTSMVLETSCGFTAKTGFATLNEPIAILKG